MQAIKFYCFSADQTANQLKSNIHSGLSLEEAKKRLDEYGPNQLQQKKSVSAVIIFLGQFNDFIVWVLIGASLVSGFLQEWVDAFAIITIVVINAILGFVQEYRAEKSLAALRKLTNPSSKVIRAGKNEVIASAQLVVGDLIELEAGDNVPADARLVWVTSNFSVQESSLTGESAAVVKTTAILEGKEAALADRLNMVYMGTSVVSGKARALIISVGMNTELGLIAGMVQETVKETTPLQKKLEEFGKWIVVLCFVLVGLVFLLEWSRGGKVIDVFLTAVSLAVAAIPEGLPAVVTISLALGVHRMVKRHALIRRLSSVETLGCATVICSDKTGTLTKNEMTVQAIFSGGRLFEVSGVGYAPKGVFSLDKKEIRAVDYPDLLKTLTCAVLCNGASLKETSDGYKIAGDPTEGSLLSAAGKAGLWKNDLEKQACFIDEIPFDSDRKKMTIIREYKGKRTAFVKGAADLFLEDAVEIEENGILRKLTPEDKASIHKCNEELASSALRVLAVGYRDLSGLSEEINPRVIEKGLVFAGLIAMMDPPREEVKMAVGLCREAGIKIVMITGDHKNTAVAIAGQLGFFNKDSLALSGEELDKLSDPEFDACVANVAVYARVSPEHKLRVVKAWRKRGEVVAMTGDGVNDAAAVKESDIGIAMGITGTDVTKEVSDMVITDDNFASIVDAVEEGRGIYDNIRKSIHYLLSCNTGEILVMLLASLLGLPVPLLPIQILWVNLVTDSLPALALAVDPVDPDIMKKNARKSSEAIINKKQAVLMLLQGAFIAFCSLFAFCFVLFIEKEGLIRARTCAFIVLACSQLFHAFNCRSQKVSLFKLGLFTNLKLLYAAGISFVLLTAVIYAPFLQKIFKIEALGLRDWLLVMLVSSLPLWAMQLIKKLYPSKMVS
ncbi:MAG: cation-translocating P-type ATPase [Candidatus Omnitrophica bacterium]|jgi:Ca2+-transporting ATPase|nr:cation-translocating P-type ATPase [Candidatus Omnitrophota bacterium]